MLYTDRSINCGFLQLDGALTPRHRSHHCKAGIAWASKGSCNFAPGISSSVK